MASKNESSAASSDISLPEDTSSRLPVVDSSHPEAQPGDLDCKSSAISTSPSHGSPKPTSLSEEPSPTGSATPKASGSTEIDGEDLVQKLHDLTIRGGYTDDSLIPDGEASQDVGRGANLQGRSTAVRRASPYRHEPLYVDQEVDGDLPPADKRSVRLKLLDCVPLPCQYPDDSNPSIVTLFDLLCVSIPKIPEAYDADALLETKTISDAELNLPEEYQLRKIVFLPGLVSRLFQKAQKILQRFIIHWSDPKVNRFIAKIHPSLTSTSMPATIWSEEDIVTWSGSVIGRPTMEVIHAVLTNRLDGTHDARRKYPNIASCHHKDPVVPDMGVVRKGNHSKTADLAVTVEMKTQAAYRVKGTKLGKFQDLQSLRSDDQIGQAMKYNWPEGTLNSDNDSQTRMLAQVWTQMVYKKTRLGELTTVERTTFMARGTGSESDTMFISPAYGYEDCPLLAAFCWHAMATTLISIEDLDLPSKVNTEWWGKEITQFEGAGVAPASLYTYEKRLTNRQIVLAEH